MRVGFACAREKKTQVPTSPLYLPCLSPISPLHLPHISPISQTLLEQQKQKLASWVTSEDAIAKAVADPKGSVSLPLARTLPLEPLPPPEVTPQVTPSHPKSPQVTPKSPLVTPSFVYHCDSISFAQKNHIP